MDSKNNIIVTEDDGHLIAMIGLENVIVAHTPDATLVCRSQDVEKLKELLKRIEEAGGENFL
jgi:mannose-1-phosphate guanylyltransferase